MVTRCCVVLHQRSPTANAYHKRELFLASASGSILSRLTCSTCAPAVPSQENISHPLLRTRFFCNRLNHKGWLNCNCYSCDLWCSSASGVASALSKRASQTLLISTPLCEVAISDTPLGILSVTYIALSLALAVAGKVRSSSTNRPVPP